VITGDPAEVRNEHLPIVAGVTAALTGTVSREILRIWLTNIAKDI
jgi:hypothetical protein